MAGKRNWYVIYKHLLIAADGKESKGKPLGDMLYVPEPFSVDRKDEIHDAAVGSDHEDCGGADWPA